MSLATDNNCPYCGTNLLGPEIPEKDRELFGGATHFRRQIGIETKGYDGVSFWMCPDCGAEENRWTGKRVK